MAATKTRPKKTTPNKKVGTADTLTALYENRIGNDWRKAPFVLRITEHADIDGPVIVVKERVDKDDAVDVRTTSSLHQRARLYNGPLQVCLGVLQDVLRKVEDVGGVPYGLERFLSADGIRRAWTLPLDAEAGYKLSLIGKLHENLRGQPERQELIARRVAALGKDEAGYFFSWTFRQDGAQNRWALSGLRVFFGGKSGDVALERQLNSYRSRRQAN